MVDEAAGCVLVAGGPETDAEGLTTQIHYNPLWGHSLQA